MDGPHRESRRAVVATVCGALLVGLPGCSGSIQAEVTETSLVRGRDRIGVSVTLRTSEAGEEWPATVHVELLDGETVVAEKRESVTIPGRGTGTFTVWFDDLSAAEMDRIDGSRASVVG